MATSVVRFLIATTLVLSQALSASGANVMRTHLRAVATDARQTPVSEAVQREQSLQGFFARAASDTRARTLSMVHWARSEVSQPMKEVEIVIPFRRMLTSALIWLVLCTLIAYFYKSRREMPKQFDTPEKIDPKDELENGHFNCFSDVNICLMSTFCSGIRWADTMGMAGILAFWAAFSMYMVLATLNFIFPAMGFGFILLIVCVYLRQSLRNKFEVPSFTVVTILQDFLYYCCCPCCAIAQEARVMEQAYQVGHKVTQDVEY